MVKNDSVTKLNKINRRKKKKRKKHYHLRLNLVIFLGKKNEGSPIMKQKFNSRLPLLFPFFFPFVKVKSSTPYLWNRESSIMASESEVSVLYEKKKHPTTHRLTFFFSVITSFFNGFFEGSYLNNNWIICTGFRKNLRFFSSCRPPPSQNFFHYFSFFVTTLFFKIFFFFSRFSFLFFISFFNLSEKQFEIPC